MADSFWRLRKNPRLCLSGHLAPPAFLCCPHTYTPKPSTPLYSPLPLPRLHSAPAPSLPPSLQHLFWSQILSQMKTLVIISFRNLWFNHILTALLGTSHRSRDMSIFENHYSGPHILFRSSDYSVALCKFNNSVPDTVTLNKAVPCERTCSEDRTVAFGACRGMGWVGWGMDVSYFHWGGRSHWHLTSSPHRLPWTQ